MKGQRGQTISSSSPCCNVHPKEVLVGVCPLCLKERLLTLLASQQQRKPSPPSPLSSSSKSNSSIVKDLQDSISFSKKKKKKHRRFFSFSSSFLGFSESQHHKSHLHNHDSVISPEDSFISIKFEDNGAASWDKGKVRAVTLEHCKGSSWDHHSNVLKETKKKEMMIQHPDKSRASLRWRKRIGQLLHIIRLRRPSACHVSSKVEGFDASSRWIRPSTTKKFPN